MKDPWRISEGYQLSQHKSVALSSHPFLLHIIISTIRFVCAVLENAKAGHFWNGSQWSLDPGLHALVQSSPLVFGMACWLASNEYSMAKCCGMSLPRLGYKRWWLPSGLSSLWLFWHVCSNDASCYVVSCAMERSMWLRTAGGLQATSREKMRPSVQQQSKTWILPIIIWVILGVEALRGNLLCGTR